MATVPTNYDRLIVSVTNAPGITRPLACIVTTTDTPTTFWTPDAAIVASQGAPQSVTQPFACNATTVYSKELLSTPSRPFQVLFFDPSDANFVVASDTVTDITVDPTSGYGILTVDSIAQVQSITNCPTPQLNEFTTFSQAFTLIIGTLPTSMQNQNVAFALTGDDGQLYGFGTFSTLPQTNTQLSMDIQIRPPPEYLTATFMSVPNPQLVGNSVRFKTDNTSPPLNVTFSPPARNCSSSNNNGNGGNPAQPVVKAFEFVVLLQLIFYGFLIWAFVKLVSILASARQSPAPAPTTYQPTTTSYRPEPPAYQPQQQY